MIAKSAKDTQVLERTLSITEISKIRSGAQVIRDTRIWDYIPELLRSSSLEIHQSTCDILRNLAFRETASLATVKVKSVLSKWCFTHCIAHHTIETVTSVFANMECTMRRSGMLYAHSRS